MARVSHSVLVGIIAFAFFFTPAQAQEGQYYRPAVKISRTDQSVIASYLRNTYPHFLANPSRPYVVGRKLPDGTAYELLTETLGRRLNPGGGHEYLQVGRDVLLVASATGVVVGEVRLPPVRKALPVWISMDTEAGTQLSELQNPTLPWRRF